MNLSGHPLHSRLQTVDVRRDAAAARVEAGHLDLRKRGFVPVGADLQASGIIHQMRVRGVVDPRRAALQEVETEMPAVAFEPSGLTRGETCRDVAGRIGDLRDVALDERYARSVGAAMGGTRGCSHVLSLTHHLGSALRNALRVAEQRDLDWSSGAARRLFHRALVIDGAEPEEGRIELAAQLSDIHFAPAAQVSNPMDRFAHQEEVRLLARIGLGGVTLDGVEVAVRRRGRGDLDEAPWQRLDGELEDLIGAPLVGGFAAAVLRRFPDPVEERPMVDVLLALAPAFIQVCACFSETWPGKAMRSDTLVGVGGIPDSCYMWRRGGALDSRKKPTDPNARL